jgi:hypothetical protein
LNAGEGVGDGHAEVVVAVGGEDDVLGAGDLGEEHAEGGGVFLWRGVADGVGDVDGGGSGLDRDGDDLDEEVGVGAGGVLGGELDVVAERAGETDSAAWTRASARVIFSLASRWRSEEARKVWMRDFSAGSMERAAASMSSRLQRAREAMRALRTSRAIWRMESESPWLAMAKPASMTSTPRSANWWAMRSFSSWCMVQPGDCSPSRRVVSKKTIWLEDIGPGSLDLDLIIMHAYDGR